MKAFNGKSFAAIARAVIKAGTTVRDGLQDLIEMGLSKYNDNGDTVYLTKALETAQGTRSVKADDIKAYIRAHANVRWVEDKEGGARFKKASSKQAVKVTEPSQTWYEFRKPETVTPDFDVVSRVKSLRTSLHKALEQDKCKDKDLALAIDDALAKFVA